MLTLEQAKGLSKGDFVHYTGRQICSRTVGPRGGETTKIVQCKVTSVQTWKREPNRVCVSVKYGMYDYAKIQEWDLAEWHLADHCPVLYPEYEGSKLIHGEFAEATRKEYADNDTNSDGPCNPI